MRQIHGYRCSQGDQFLGSLLTALPLRQYTKFGSYRQARWVVRCHRLKRDTYAPGIALIEFLCVRTSR